MSTRSAIEMHMKKIHYINFYLNQKEIEGRKLEVAAQSKILYIMESLLKAGFKVDVVSTAYTMDGMGFSPKKEIIISPEERHIYLPSMSSKKIIKKFKKAFMQVQLFLYLFKKVKKDEIVLAYHSLAYMPILKLFKKLRNVKFILEVNDLYALHYTELKKITNIKNKECNFFNLADGFLFASPFMIELVKDRKPSIISYGSYKVFPIKNRINDGRIHVIYSGVIENLRKAAKLVTNAAIYLPEDYVIHIAGYGTEANLKEIVSLCNQINKIKGYTAIKYHGLLLGTEFNNLLDNCTIAVNCHSYSNEDLWKSKYSFPSKIPLNMGHNLYLVSYNMPLILESPFAKFATFFNEFTPEAIANAIINCSAKIKNKDTHRIPIDLIRELDYAFVKSLKDLFTNI